MTKRHFSSFVHIVTDEWAAIRRDVGVLLFLVIVPMLYPLLYGYVYSPEVLRDVPTVVVDHSNSQQSREYIRKVDATPDVQVVATAPDLQAASELVRDGEAYGVIYIPSNFSLRIARGEQATVSLYCDMSGLLYYKSILIANTGVMLDTNAKLKIAKAGNTTARQDELTAYPIAYEDVAMFNPAGGFDSFLLPGMLMLIMQQTLLLGIGMRTGAVRDWGKGYGRIYPPTTLPSTMGYMVARSLPYLCVGLLVAPYILGIVPRIFSLVQVGNWVHILAFVLPFLLACIFFSMTLSLLVVKERETGILLFVFTSVPLLFISGISWPGAAVPEGWRLLSYAFPSTFGINGFVRLNSMGALLSDVPTEYWGLWAQALVYLLFSSLLIRREQLKAKQ